ncbi:TIGR03084 family metal-binding protein [Sphaerimonospora sp. CA-214678]|uniref:TIGR03084 family metal-binding protein n=1 Tax=Sphaerimonospora sp. CA-214678 TaxID=3240029 RepID=UPI003D936772
MRLDEVLKDLAIEGDEVDRLVADLEPGQWALPTPAPGWTVADQIAHLTFVFRLAGAAAADPRAFQAMTARAAEVGFDAAVNAALADYAGDTPAELLARWRDQRATTLEALAAVPPDQTVPWLVNPLPPAVLACAGIMEVFAHGQDVADALGVRMERTDRIRHLCGFAVLTRDFGYEARGLTPPEAVFRFELTAPSGQLWEFGPPDAAQRITGPAADFCLLVTRRRHRDDLAVTAVGAEADHWLDIAQAYRGPAGAGRTPGQFAGLRHGD